MFFLSLVNVEAEEVFSDILPWLDQRMQFLASLVAERFYHWGVSAGKLSLAFISSLRVYASGGLGEYESFCNKSSVAIVLNSEMTKFLDRMSLYIMYYSIKI